MNCLEAKIHEQIKAGTFPVRLNGEEWVNGDNNWLLDVVAPDEHSSAAVVRHFGQVAGHEGIHLHQIVSGSVDPALLAKAAGEKTADQAAQSGMQKSQSR